MNTENLFQHGAELSAMMNRDSLVLHRIPSDVREFVTNQRYWEKECDVIYLAKIESPDESLITTEEVQMASAFLVRVKATIDGFFINGKEAFSWTDAHDVEDDCIIYTSSQKIVFGFVKDEKNIVFEGNKYKGWFWNREIDPAEAKEMFAKARAKVLPICAKLLLSDSKWNKWIGVGKYINLDIHPVSKTQLLFSENGIFVGDSSQPFALWSDYIIAEVRPEAITLITKETAEDFFKGNPGKQDLSFTSSCIVTTTVQYSFYISKEDLINLEIEEYRPHLWESYKSLIKEESTIKTQDIIYELNGNLEKGVLSIIYTKTNKGFYHVLLDLMSISIVNDGESVYDGDLFGFESHAATIELPNQTVLTLPHKFHHENETHRGCAWDYYMLNRTQLRQLATAKSATVVFVGNDRTWRLDGAVLIESARAFEQELFNSPKYLQNYYDALIAQELGQWEESLRLINDARSIIPNNYYFNEVHSVAVAEIKKIEELEVQKIRDVLKEKKYEQAYKMIDSLVSRFDDDWLPAFKKEIAKLWATSLYQQAQEERKRHDIDKALLTIEKVLKLDYQEEYKHFRADLVPEHIAYLKENIQKCLDEKKYDKALSVAKRASSLFPDEKEFWNYYTSIGKEMENDKRRRILIAVVASLVLTCFVLFLLL